MAEKSLATIAWKEVKSGPLNILCNVCQRHVDYYNIEKRVARETDPYTGLIKTRHTGEIVVTIRCHGEEWRQSSWGSTDNITPGIVPESNASIVKTSKAKV